MHTNLHRPMSNHLHACMLTYIVHAHIQTNTYIHNHSQTYIAWSTGPKRGLHSYPDLEFWMYTHCHRRLHRQIWTLWTILRTKNVRLGVNGSPAYVVQGFESRMQRGDAVFRCSITFPSSRTAGQYWLETHLFAPVIDIDQQWVKL